MIEWRNCHHCNHYDITGKMTCTEHPDGHYLCPICTTSHIGLPSESTLQVKLGFLRELSAERMQVLMPYLLKQLAIHHITPTTDIVNAALIGYALRMHVEARLLDNVEPESAFEGG